MRVQSLLLALVLLAVLFVAAWSPAAAVNSELVRTAGADAASAEDAAVVADESDSVEEEGEEADSAEEDAAEEEEQEDSGEADEAAEGADEESEEEGAEEEAASEEASSEEESEESAVEGEGDDARFAATAADVTADAEANKAEAAAKADADISSDAELEAQTVIGVGAVQYVAEGSEEEEEAEEAEARAAEEAAAARFAESAAAVEYDEAFAKEALAYAEAAYHLTPGKCIRALNEKNAAFRVHHKVKQSVFDGSTLYGYTGVDRHRIVIAFSGDVPLSSLAKRLYKGKPVKVKSLCKSCKTHKYYAHVNSKICPEMMASAKTLAQAHPRYEVVLTGHGFGGALASLCGYEMEMNRVWGFGHVRRFISFGAPRSGNAHWARKFNQIFPAAIRVTHADDPIPHIAPCHADPETQRCIEIKDRKKRLWAFHAPTQVWYPNDMPAAASNDTGHFTVCKGPNWGEDTACRSHPLGFSMADHALYFGQTVAERCQQILSELPAADTVPAGSLPSASSSSSDAEAKSD